MYIIGFQILFLSCLNCAQRFDFFALFGFLFFLNLFLQMRILILNPSHYLHERTHFLPDPVRQSRQWSRL